jgi:hypothetical protein
MRNDEASSDAQKTSGSSSIASQSQSVSSLSGKRAADMLASYKSNLEPGSGTTSGLASGKNNSSGSALLSEIRDGAERLAKELHEYLANSTNQSFRSKKETAPLLNDEAIADLQLATARKLREVSLPYLVFMCSYAYISVRQKSANEKAGCCSSDML